MIGFIGSGRVAGSFGKYLAKHGIVISGFYDIIPEKAATAANLCSSRVYHTAEQLLRECPVVFISTNDDQIGPVARQIAGIIHCSETVIGHFSGVHNSKLLADILPENYICFSLHPLQSFSGSAADDANLTKTFLTLEGEGKALDVVRRITDRLPNNVLSIEPQHKILYHAAGVIASNYITTVIAESMAYLKVIGIESEQAGEMLEPLVRGTVHNAFSMGPETALTGPIARGDYATIAAHLDTLNQTNQQKENLYRELGLATLHLASKSLLTDKEKIKNIENLLKAIW